MSLARTFRPLLHRYASSKSRQLVSMPAAQQRVLVCGAGVAGSIAAFWLARSGFQVVVIERALEKQKLGQGIEIEEPALQVVKKMGVLEQLEAVKTGELGTDVVDENDQSWARLGLDEGFSPTGSLELMRGDLTEVLYQAADRSEDVEYRFETTLRGLRQVDDKVLVDIEEKRSKTTRTEEFDFVIGADGVNSRTRLLTMGTPEELDCFNRLGINCAYFSIPREDRDWPYSRVCNFTGGRLIWARPVSQDAKHTSVYFVLSRDDNAALRAANDTGDRKAQKEAWASIFGDCGWESKRIVPQMLASDNFYSDDLKQVKLKKWSQGRVVLVGDAAWAPTPVTGMGNQLAIMGAWVLAQEMAREGSTTAYERYEERLRKYVDDAQSVPLGGYAPFLVNPQSATAILCVRTILWGIATVGRVATRLGLGKYLPDGADNYFDLQMEEQRLEREKRK